MAADDPPPAHPSVDLIDAGGAAVDALTREVARAAAAAALFGRDPSLRIGRYRLRARVGVGGMGAVWSAEDDELGRSVALKLATAGDAAARQRALDEGRALARLSHPNVVPIYDVVDSAHGVFLVMELVAGETLRAYAARTDDVRAVVRAYREAAAGLAAAHAAGLIHRDFKPDNAVVGADGRVRVLDFGLAVSEAAPGTSVAGTPRYMAPEQRAGAVTAAVDQYALCASLREALGDRLPRWVRPIVERGGAAEPAARFPSMDALAEALGRDPRRVWRRRGVAGLVVAVGVAGVVIGQGRATAPSLRCDGGAALMATTWTQPRAQVASHLAGLGGDYASAAGARLMDTLDGYARAWQLSHRGACQAHGRGELAAGLFDRRGQCLAQARASLAAVTDLATTATPADLPGLVEAVAALPTVARCDDDSALASPVAPPPAAVVTAVAAVDDRLAEVAVLRDAGRIDQARAAADHAVAAAEQLAYPPLVARARLARGRVALTSLTGTRGDEDFVAATNLALGAGDDLLAVEAFARHAFASVTGTRGQPVDGLTLIEPLANRLGENGVAARALLLGNLGAIALNQGDRATARARFAQAAAALPAVTGPAAIELAFVRQGALSLEDDPVAVARDGAALVEFQRTRLGAEHPTTLLAQIYVAQLGPSDEQVRTALASPCRTLATVHGQLRAGVSECSAEATLLALIAGDAADAGRWAQIHAAAMATSQTPALLARARGLTAAAAGDVTTAIAAFTAARAALRIAPDSPWWLRSFAIECAIAAAAVARAGGDDATRAAEVRYARAQLALAAPGLSAVEYRRRARTLDQLATGSAPSGVGR
ncbi:MAG: serine/threonine-protein kinase [Kofleriaceae bacterium]